MNKNKIKVILVVLMTLQVIIVIAVLYNYPTLECAFYCLLSTPYFWFMRDNFKNLNK